MLSLGDKYIPQLEFSRCSGKEVPSKVCMLFPVFISSKVIPRMEVTSKRPIGVTKARKGSLVNKWPCS